MALNRIQGTETHAHTQWLQRTPLLAVNYENIKQKHIHISYTPCIVSRK